MKLVYYIYVPSEFSAGIIGFTDNITIEVESGDPSGDESEFAEFMRESLSEWYDGGYVTLIKKGE